ncbi:hypothetical protein [Chondromyces crocatus]|uniref:Uncharacterized protein n=1 Tax=Chondromyces crocatus TaxID=52 RepID=A0A0K1EGV8_CHOCO|nr:hypothetical protein [Chondromyces crocatus]AKT40074.1 uncharacterized protein CMC5_042270 [Chondromyces crocatus]
MAPLYRRLRFPTRAEHLAQFSTYQVRLDHWRPLAAPFEDAFTGVYERGDAAILLIHGAQGSGKTLFCDRLERDFLRAAEGEIEPQRENLWHTLVGGEPMSRDTIREATAGTELHRIRPEEGWLAKQREFARGDRRRKVRVFLLDDAHNEVFLCEFAGVGLDWFRARPRKESEMGIVGSVGQNLVAECRGDFQRSIFLLTSASADLFMSLHQEIERWHARLSVCKELPLPRSDVKETIVRTNTNRLNDVSYWYCLDAAGPDEKKRVHHVLGEQKGFTDSFLAVDDALKSSRRRGAPASRNVITLVTLGAVPPDVKAFLETREVEPSEEYLGTHLGVWYVREQWASAFVEGSVEQARRAELVQSEFALRWVTLDMRGVYALCRPPVTGDLGMKLLDAIQLFPSSTAEQQRHRATYQRLDLELQEPALGMPDLDTFAMNFRTLGQRRNVLYEPAIAARVVDYNKGFEVFPRVRPDLIASEYSPCAVTSARSGSPADINKAIQRMCHAIEFTAFLDHQLKGLDAYLLGKIESYAMLLEQV